MVRKHHHHEAHQAAPAPDGAPASEAADPLAALPGLEAPPPGSLEAPGGEALQRLEREAADWKDRCLRAAAEFENFKKRASREKTETWGRAQADLIARALDSLDDLGRIAALDPAQTSAQVLHEGAGLVERKLQKALEGAGLERLDPVGQPFDPNLHEAVMMIPAATPEADHTVGTVLQPGYRMNGVLLRPARVAVCSWTAPAAEGAEA